MNGELPMPSKTARKAMGKRLRWFLSILFSAAFMAVIFFSAWRWHLKREIGARIAAIHAQGLPTDWEELSKWLAVVEDAENAALIYANAADHIVTNGVTDNYRFELLRRAMPLTEAQSEAVASALEVNQRVLKIVYTASNIRKSRYPIEYLDGPLAKLPHLTQLRRIEKLLECEAVVKADAKDGNAAATAILGSFEIARSLEGEPFVISQLSATRLLASGCESLERVLCRISLSDELLAKISDQIIEAEETNRFLTGLIGERALDGEFIRLAQDDLSKMLSLVNQGKDEENQITPPSRNPGFLWEYIGFFDRDRNFFLQAIETNILIAAVGPPKSLSMTNETEKLRIKAISGLYLDSSLFLPTLSRLAVRDAANHASLRVALTAVAIERWRGNHEGSAPENLATLVPSFLPFVPVDPYDGQPLRYKKLAKGFVVYSIGPDGQDDGGKDRSPRPARGSRNLNEKYDITFTVER